MPAKRPPHLTLDLDCRLLEHAARLAFLRDALTQTKPIEVPEFELGESSLLGLALILDDLRRDTEETQTLLFSEKTEQPTQEGKNV